MNTTASFLAGSSILLTVIRTYVTVICIAVTHLSSWPPCLVCCSNSTYVHLSALNRTVTPYMAFHVWVVDCSVSYIRMAS